MKEYFPRVIGQRIGQYYLLIENDYKIFIGKDLPGEYTQSKYTKALLNSPARHLTRIKNEIVGNIKEVIEIANNRKWKENKKARHNIDGKMGFYNFDSFVGVKKNNGDIQEYKVKLVIRNNENGEKYLYDIQDIKKVGDTLSHATQGNHAYRLAQKRRPSPTKYDSTIPNNNQSVNSDGIRKDSKGQKLTKEQEIFFENSQVIDAQGNLKVMYHGLNSDFVVFDTNAHGGKTGTGQGMAYSHTLFGYHMKLHYSQTSICE